MSEAQSQESLNDQLLAVARLANEHGFYDASDWIIRTVEAVMEGRVFMAGDA